MGWRFGYLLAAGALFLPTVARLNAGRNDPVDDVTFFVVGIVVWGTIINVVRAIWTKMRQHEVPKAVVAAGRADTGSG